MDRKEYEARKEARQEIDLSRRSFFFHPDKVVKYTGYLQLFTAALAITTAALVVATIYTALVLHSTDEKIGSQVEAINRQLTLMEADQRPWVFLADVRVGSMSFEPRNGELKLTFDFKTKNTGKSPAQGVRVDAIVLNQIPDFDPVSEQRKFAASDCSREADIFSYPLFPGETANPVFQVQMSIDREQIEKALGPPERKVINPFLIGCVSYQFGPRTTRHQTGFIFEIGSKKEYIVLDSTRTDHFEVISRSEMRFSQYHRGWYAN